MSDYGHDLVFGSFLTPQAGRPDDVVQLAVASEELGLDLVTFQDHPYNAGFLDTWTLLSFVAARTERVHLAPNVANLPLRPASVLARAAASLDLLSHGRAELGLGSGAFWDGIAAMGGARLTPGEGVTALSEAIDVIRGIWSTDEHGILRAGGEHHHVAGANRGPRAPHDVGIWLGAYKPRMLRLTGAKADGWLPSAGYLQPGDLARGNVAIDEAATEAGRDPREIRRLINLMGQFRDGGGTGPLTHGAGAIDGPVERWVDELVALALEDGVGTFVLAGDDPRTLATFAEEVVPAVREAVAAGRASSGTKAGPVRSTRALALRAPGIDYDAIPAALRGKAVEPGDREYALLRSTYIRGGRPGLVILAEDADDVVAGLAFARAQQAAQDSSEPRLELSVRSGGHGISGRSTNHGGIVLDLSRMNEITVLDEATRRVRLGPGASWGHVADALGGHGWAMSSGDAGDVGVGGLATAGGIGLLGRKFGLTIDHVVAYEVVLADGPLTRASADENPDLFWALRGAGGNFGVVTAVEIEAYALGPIVVAVLLYDATDTAGLVERWGAAVEAAPRELTSFLTLQPAGGGNPAIAQALTVFASDDVDAAERALGPLFGVGPVLQQQAQIAPYAAVVAPQDAVHTSEGEGAAFRNSLVDHLDAQVAGAAATFFASGRAQMFQVRAVGGAVNDLPADATSYAHRDGQNFDVSGVGFGDADAFDALWDETLRPFQHGEYVSFDTDATGSRVQDAFPEPAYTRLRELKRRYDPENLFDRNFPIPPADG